MLDGREQTALPFPGPRLAVRDHPPSPAHRTDLERVSSRALAKEVERLKKRVHQQDHALARLTDALLALRHGGKALREENRELRLALEAGRRRSAASGSPPLAGG